MTTLDHIREVLHAVTAVLVGPVMLCLLLLAAAMLFVLGGFAREAIERLRGRRPVLEHAQRTLEGAAVAANAAEALDLRIERVLQNEESRRWKRVHFTRMAVRLGPALGLMGTLIPMAFALQGLADGDMPALASNLVTAFAATVVGLSISVIAYAITGLREQWTRADLQALSWRAEELLRAHTPRGRG